MTLEQLRIFIAVVDTGGFSSAARALYISHSTTSRQVSALEESLGVRLLVRTSRSVSPTDKGRVLYDRAKALLESEAALRRELSASGGRESESPRRESFRYRNG
jgi:LysR family nitrogen assimilation transcriptional regulator